MRKNLKYAVIDIEASNWTNLKLLGFYDGVNYKLFYKAEDFLKFILKQKNSGLRIFAHFGGRYDFLFLLEPLTKFKNITFDIIDSGSRILLITVKFGKEKIYFVDSFSLLPKGLKELTKSFDVIHKKKDVDIGKVKNFKSKKVLEYLENDCKGLYEVLEKFKNWGLNNGKLKVTLASQSLSVFRNEFYKKQIYQLGADCEEFIRQCYFGGRVEIFKMYGKNLNYYDFNSLYPYCMLEYMPIGSPIYTKQEASGLIGFYKITCDNIGNIPLLCKVINNKLLFVNGKSDYYVTSADLESLRKLKIDYKIIEGYYFSEKAKIFESYVKKLYKIKEQSEKGSIDYIISKLMLNSLYGKFGQKREQETVVSCQKISMIGDRKLVPYYEDLGLYKESNISKSKYILPHISAYITSLARNKLFWVLKECEDDLYYCDTDSIVTGKKLKTGYKLGELKLEYADIKGAIFLLPKVYSLALSNNQEVSHIKGFQSKVSYQEFIKALFFSNYSGFSKKQERICGYKENLKLNQSLKIKRISFNKVIRQKYNKREVINLINTKPLNINNLLDSK